MTAATKIRNEVNELAELARRRDPAGRATLYHNIVNLFEEMGSALSATERSLMCDILEHLARDVEMSLRKELAERLLTAPNPPVDLVLILANDQIEVARPLLLYSKILKDNDLIDIIRHRSLQHQISIAARENLSAKVSSVLVQMGSPSVMNVLLNNASAVISPEAFNLLVNQAQHQDSLQAPLIKRADLPPALAKRMYLWVSDALKEAILANFSLSQTELNSGLEAAIAGLTAEDEFCAGQAGMAKKMVDKLFEAGEVNPAFLMKCLHQGQVPLFEEAFAKLCRVPADVLRKIIYNRGSDGLAVACRFVGIDRSVFLTIYRLTRLSRQESPELTDIQVSHAFEIFEKFDKRRAEITLHRWAEEESKTRIF
jgi:uncharacterized protein (DUF2336 family)